MSVPEVLVTGGTGALGRRAVERFEGAGVGSRVLSRSGRPGTYKEDLMWTPSSTGCSWSPRGPASRT